MSKTNLKLTDCELSNLEIIKDRFGLSLLLTVQQTASLVGTTQNNVFQMIKRGHVPFNLVRLGSRVLFPVLSVASWLCGTSENDSQLAVKLPKSTPLKIRSQSDLKARLDLLKLEIAKRAQEIREDDNQNENQNGNKTA